MSDLSKYCVDIGERSSKRRFPLFKIMLYAYRVVMVVGVGILYKVAIFPFCICISGNQRMPLIHTLKVSDYHAKVSDLWLFNLCARHICCGIPHCTYTLLISEHNLLQLYPVEKRLSPF